MLDTLANPAIRRLVAAAAASQLGDWAARLAVALIVLEQTGIATGVGVAAALYVLPWLGPGLVLARYGDRMDRVRLLVGCEGARAVLYGLLAISVTMLPIAAVLAGVAVVALIDPVWESNRSALLVDVASPDEYAPAQKLMNAVNQGATMAGWALGGFLVAGLGAAGTLGVNALTFAVSAVLVAGISAESGTDRPKSAGSLRTAFDFLASDRTSAVALVTTALFTTTAMAMETQAPVYGLAIGLSERWVGVLAAMVPLVTLVGVVAIPNHMDDRNLLRASFGVAALASVLGTLAFLESNLVLAFVGYAAIGVPFATSTAANIVVGRRLPPENRAAIFSVVQTAIFLALSAGAVLGGPLSDLSTPQTANVVLAIATAVICATGAALAPRAQNTVS